MTASCNTFVMQLDSDPLTEIRISIIDKIQDNEDSLVILKLVSIHNLEFMSNRNRLNVASWRTYGPFKSLPLQIRTWPVANSSTYGNIGKIWTVPKKVVWPRGPKSARRAQVSPDVPSWPRFTYSWPKLAQTDPDVPNWFRCLRCPRCPRTISSSSNHVT